MTIVLMTKLFLNRELSRSPHSVTQQANLLNAVVVQTYYKESRSKDTAKEYAEMDKAG